MISIQELGMQILNHTPLKFYVFGGVEYGVKMRYIDELVKYYGSKEEYSSVADLINYMSTKHLVPLDPKVYVIRYDEIFYSQVSEKYATKIQKANIIGTAVVIYDSPKIITKMNKYIPEFTAIIDSVNPQFITKYLHSDFPNIPDRLINVAVACSSDYGQAKNICTSMTFDLDHVNRLSDNDIKTLFGHQDLSTQSQIRQGIAAKNFNYLMQVLQTYDGELDNVIYTVLQTMIDLDKLVGARYGQSDIKDYVKLWKPADIYYMFMHAYSELKKLRSSSSYDVHNSIVYLFGLLNFSSIPSVEEMMKL